MLSCKWLTTLYTSCCTNTIAVVGHPCCRFSHAEAEVLVLLDLVNVVLGEVNQAPLPLPPKTLGGTRIASKPRTRAEAHAEELLQYGVRQQVGA